MTPVPRVPPRLLEDRDITLAVERRLMLDDAVPAHRIDVSTEDGIVTLSGSVNRLTAKMAARYAAETVRGVVGVFNEIEVEPAPRLDAHIRRDVIAALTDDPVVDILDIDVHVENQVVKLSGVVDSPLERSAAEERAQGVAGVVEVQNLLTYEEAPARRGNRTRAGPFAGDGPVRRRYASNSELKTTQRAARSVRPRHSHQEASCVPR